MRKFIVRVQLDSKENDSVAIKLEILMAALGKNRFQMVIFLKRE
jgi:hypothetical protein